MYLFEKESADNSAEKSAPGTNSSSELIVGHLSFGGILRGAAQFCYLGYGLDQSRQKRGYMTEILSPAIRYAFEVLGIHRIMANYMPTNEASGKVLKRLGFTVEGYARDYLCLNGKWEDHILTSLTNPEDRIL